MNKAEKYDMKQAYNKDLTKSARFNYLKNAMHDKKGMSMKDEGVMMMGQVKQGSMATMRSGNVGNYTGNHPRFTGVSMNADLAFNPVDDITQNKGAADTAPIANLNKGYGQQVGKPSVANKYDEVVLGGNKRDNSKTNPGKKDYAKQNR